LSKQPHITKPPVRGKYYLYSTFFIPALEATHSPVQWVPGYFQDCKVAGVGLISEDNDAWSCTSTPSYVTVSWCPKENAQLCRFFKSCHQIWEPQHLYIRAQWFVVCWRGVA